jgi:amicyanin
MIATGIALSVASTMLFASAVIPPAGRLGSGGMPRQSWGMMNTYYGSASIGEDYSQSPMTAGYGMMGMMQGGMNDMMRSGMNYCPMSSNTNGRNVSASYGTVVILNNAFNPSSVTVKKGGAVTWFNMDTIEHTVTSGTHEQETGLFDSGLLGHMQSFSFTFTETGTYEYHCDPHPWMSGTVIVEE